MNLKTIAYNLFLIAIGLTVVCSCGKENLDTTTIDTEDLNPVTIICEMEVEITEPFPGTLSTTVIGGEPPYTYAWSNGATISGPSANAGENSVTVTDAAGCTAEGSIIAEGGGSNPCGSFMGGLRLDNDMLTAYTINGIEPIGYTWSNGETTNTLQNGVLDESYTVTITDAIGCSTILPVTIGSCNEFFDLEWSVIEYTITLYPIYGVEPYVYNWITTGETTASITVSGPGTYVVIVSDQNGCIAEHGIQVN